MSSFVKNIFSRHSMFRLATILFRYTKDIFPLVFTSFCWDVICQFICSWEEICLCSLTAFKVRSWCINHVFLFFCISDALTSRAFLTLDRLPPNPSQILETLNDLPGSVSYANQPPPFWALTIPNHYLPVLITPYTNGWRKFQHPRAHWNYSN